jgi:hypothetical protein
MRQFWKEYRWVLWPWGLVRRLEDKLDGVCGENARLADRVTFLREHEHELLEQIRWLRDRPRPPRNALSGDHQLPEPEWAVVGVSRPGGKRLHASMKLDSAHFGMTDISDPPPRYAFDAVMDEMLIIDKPTYGEAMARLAEILANRQRQHEISSPGVIPAGTLQPGDKLALTAKGPVVRTSPDGITAASGPWDCGREGCPAPDGECSCVRDCGKPGCGGISGTA